MFTPMIFTFYWPSYLLSIELFHSRLYFYSSVVRLLSDDNRRRNCSSQSGTADSLETMTWQKARKLTGDKCVLQCCIVIWPQSKGIYLLVCFMCFGEPYESCLPNLFSSCNFKEGYIRKGWGKRKYDIIRL